MPYKDPERQKRSQRKSKQHRRKLRYSVVEEYKLDHGCSACEYKRCSEALDFHHRNSDEKTEGISIMIRKCRPIESILAEMKKCDILCANCHRELHAGYMGD